MTLPEPLGEDVRDEWRPWAVAITDGLPSVSGVQRGPLGVSLYWGEGLQRVLITSLRGGGYVLDRLTEAGLPKSVPSR